MEKSMRTNESGKRLLILLLSFLGILMITGMYAYTWIFCYHRRIMWNIKLFFWGHILMIFIYFILLFFFASTYGGMKIGYLKPMDVFFSQVFSLLCVNVITYFQLSIIEVKLVKANDLIWMTIVQIAFAGFSEPGFAMEFIAKSFHPETCF